MSFTHHVFASECYSLSGSIENLDYQGARIGEECGFFLHAGSHGRENRSFSFGQNGLIQVGEAYDIRGGAKDSTGTRTYFIFPRAQKLQVDNLMGTSLRLTLTSGDRIYFDPGSSSHAGAAAMRPSIKNYPASLQFIESAEITPSDRGGVEIKQSSNSKTLIMDCGYSFGEVPAFLKPAGHCTFRDSAGKTCARPNSELFRYHGVDGDLKFASDSSLYSYLRVNCPVLKIPAAPVAGRPDTQPVSNQAR